MNGWTKERMERQAASIHDWKPWKFAGVKSEKGKFRSRLNALKNGRHTKEMRDILRFIAECRRSIKDSRENINQS